MVSIAPTHVVEPIGSDRVKIHDVELFVGFIDGVDNPKDSDIKKFDQDRIRSIIDKTNQMISAGQATRLIPEHNSSEQNAADLGAIGRIDNIREARILGAPGIIGDITMSREHFDEFVASGSMPRRSAEIWPDGHMSEVALLGSRTPARPLPDMEFTKNGSAQRFTRPATCDLFAEPSSTPHDPGMSNVTPPNGNKDSKMPSQDEIDKLRKRISELEDENKELKKSKNAAGDDDKKTEASRDKYSHMVSAVRETFEGEIKTLNERVESLQKSNTVLQRSGIEAKISQMRDKGYGVPNDEAVEKIVDRCMKTEDPEAELEFYAQQWPQPGVRTDVGSNHAEPQGATGTSPEKMQRAAEAAADRFEKEQMKDPSLSPDMFNIYLQEELAK